MYAKELFEVDFDFERKNVGEVTFPASTLKDPHIQKAIKEVAKQTKTSVKKVTATVQSKLDELEGLAGNSPILYETINQNAAEQAIFEIFWKANIKPAGAPEFDNIVFKRLVNQLRLDYDEFFPLRSYIDKRKLITPVIRIIEPDDKLAEQITTAAATPRGEFLFNREFMQALLNYAHLKGVAPISDKFTNNGGKFPPGYSYIEFIIMHEFMHYSNDDFYYQRTIPKANPTIINWVGDFRTNYQLVKSGFEGLPMGLFNDKINYDRQTQYSDMYDIVADEFERLKPEEQKMLEKILNQMADDHEMGNEQGKTSDEFEEGEVDTEDLDDNAKGNGEAVDGDAGDEDGDEGEGKGEGDDDLSDVFSDIRGQSPTSGSRGGQGGKERELDYTKIKPQFNWKSLVSRFVKSGLSKTETTYAKPHRRSVTSIDIARQVGAGAIKPAEKPIDYNDAKIMFVIDNSGSMGWVIPEIIAEAYKLLRMPAFKKSVILVSKFSGGAELHKVNVAQDKAGKVDSPKDMPKTWDKKGTEVLGTSRGGGTEITPEMTADIIGAMSLGYNAIFMTDSDVLWDHNLPELLKCIKASPKNFFLVFDTSSSYIRFRQLTGISSQNITFFKDER